MVTSVDCCNFAAEINEGNGSLILKHTHSADVHPLLALLGGFLYMRTTKGVKNDIMSVMRELHEVTNRGLRARNMETKERENLNQRLRELRKEEEECRIAELRDWMNRLETLELVGEKKQVLEIYKLCVRHCIKAEVVFCSIKDGKFVYFSKKLNKQMLIDVPTEFSISMLSGLDFNSYERIKRKVVPNGFAFESVVGRLAKENGLIIA